MNKQKVVAGIAMILIGIAFGLIFGWAVSDPGPIDAAKNNSLYGSAIVGFLYLYAICFANGMYLILSALPKT